MRAIVITRYGGPDVLEVREQPDPQPESGQVLVEVDACGVNYRDIYEREQPGYGGEPPFVAGAEGAGTIAAVGDGVDELSVGDRIAWNAAQGSYAERVLVNADRAIAVPDGVSSELAAAALLQGMTAHYLSADTYPVRPSDDVLVHAAAGGVGLLLTQIVKLRGGRVIATTSTEDKARLAREAGADETIGYEGFAERVRDLTGGKGVAVVYDGIGKATFEDSLSSLRPRGYMVLYGAASGHPPPVEATRLLAGGSLFFTRPSLQHYTLTRSELRGRAGELFDWIAQGRVQVRIGGRYALEDARRAQEDLAARATTGKLLLSPH